MFFTQWDLHALPPYVAITTKKALKNYKTIACQHCRGALHRCYIYVLPLSCVDLRGFLHSFVASIMWKVLRKKLTGWSEVVYTWTCVDTFCDVLEAELCYWTRSFPSCSKLVRSITSFLKKAYLSLLSQPATCHNEIWIIPVKSGWNFLLLRKKQHRSLFPPVCYSFYSHQIYKVCGTSFF